MGERPFKLTIAALGGQGGGVLADWLVAIAEAQGHLAQSTSVPGVAQRTGATLYYLELFPRALAERAGRGPVMALMPVPGDVDCVLASELAEAARAVERGLVTRERTVVIASTHRTYAIGEKSALGDGMADTTKLLDLVRSSANRVVLFDMEATAKKHGSVISAVLLGALCGSGVLPFESHAFEQVVRESGLAVEANLAAFEAARQCAQAGDDGNTGKRPGKRLPELPAEARSPQTQSLLDRLRLLPIPVQALALEGVRRTLDYQDPDYARLYLDRLAAVVELEQPLAGDAGSYRLTDAVARGLALWMTFEDTIRVADLKTRSSRFARVRTEVKAVPRQIVGITEFMKPRTEEIAGTLPARIGRWVLASSRVRAHLERWTGGRRIRTRTVGGFLVLYAIAGLRRWRRSTLRYVQENARIEGWLAEIRRLAASHHGLAVELARSQRLVKGYGETHARSLRKLDDLLAQLTLLESRSDGASLLARLQEAALADEDGQALGGEIAALRSS